MNAVRLSRIWKFGWQGTVRNFWLSMIAIITVALTVMSVSVLVVINIVINESRRQLEEKLDITIFIKDEASDEETMALTNLLQQRDDTKEVIFSDKERSKQEFIKLNEGDESLIPALEDIDNPFPRYIQVKVFDPNQLGVIDELVTQDKFTTLVESTSYKETKDLIGQFVNFSKFTFKNSVVVSIFLAIISFMVVLNMIRLAIFSRREEIGIMRIVGASAQLIRLPFVVEGIIFGALAAVISLLLLLAASYWESQQIPLYFPDATWQPLHLYWQYFWILVYSNFLVAIIITSFVSYIAVRRYLKDAL